MKKYCTFATFSRTICQYLILAITLIGIQPTAILTYGDLSNNSKNSKFLISVNCHITFYIRRNFADVIKLKHIEMGKYPGLSG